MAVQTTPEDTTNSLGAEVLHSTSYQDDGQPSRRGWDPSLFVMLVGEEYHCNLCQRVLCKPMVGECGCRYCCVCITDYIGGRSGAEEIQCPVKDCEETLKISDIVVDKFAKKHLQKQRVYCENKGRGCREEMRLADLGVHLLKCPFGAVECPNGCGQRILPEDQDSHLAVHCTHRKVPCPHCGEMFMQKDFETLQKHLENECPRAEGRRRDMSDCLRTSAEEHNRKLSEEVMTMKTTLSEALSRLNQLQDTAIQPDSAPQELTGEVDKLREMMKKLQLTMVQKFDKIGKLEKNAEHAAKKSDLQSQTSRIDTLASQTTSLANRVQKLEEKAGQGPRGRKGGASPQSLEQRVSTLENQISLHAMRLAEHDVRFQVHGTTSYNGCLVWKIKDYARRKRDADTGKTLSLYSQPFFTNRYGYKMCARVYLNGDGIGKDTHVSLFFVIMKGDYDALLSWPFRQKVTLMLLDQDGGRRHLSDSFRPDPTSTSFQRPTAEMNIASGCPLFVSQEVLSNPAYLKDDTIFLKIVVDISDLSPL